MKSQKILNDPVYGFITIPSELIFSIIEHPYFQRLRRIRQLGLTDMVYPGALHTRFHHAIGAMHLMGIALSNLRGKGHKINAEEYEATLIAILLHDIGHGPFSHALEFTLLNDVNHEFLSEQLQHRLNDEFDGKLSLAIKIFSNQYERKFFHQLVSSQLDIDRLDYLQRDSFFTGVSEGTIGADRIIKMLDIVDDQIVVEEKGIYSIENFLSARRLMYWQVYLHKTTVSAEKMIIQLITRAKQLTESDEKLFATPAFNKFLSGNYTREDFIKDPNVLDTFAALDDYDIWASIKIWQEHPDLILSNISKMLLARKLFKIQISSEPFTQDELDKLAAKTRKKLGISQQELLYFMISGSMSNAAYLHNENSINILTKKGKVIEVGEASDLPNIKAMSKIVKKYYVCWAKNLIL
ncbi:HD domain-containing protein [Penaeicola halotolerans]|uniref:HD domain-containing protein n=1 Tax=Penaeicola halotolerans TaxID=2793196 RepID=UPI001CF7FF03|nr:HD domain-containing protein [Penaeicola halotolerans]